MNTSKKHISQALLLCTFLTSGDLVNASSQNPFDDAQGDARLAQLLAPSHATFLQDVTQDAYNNMKLSVTSKVDVMWRIGQGIMRGDWSILAGEAVHLTLCHLADRTQVELFSAHDKDFDRVSLDRCTDSLVKHVQQNVMRALNRDGDHYGVVRGTNQIVDIYRNRTFLQMVIDRVLPNEMPLRGMLLSLANNTHIEDLINARVRALALGVVRTLLSNQGLSVRDASGQLIVGAIKRVLPAYEDDTASDKEKPAVVRPIISSSSSNTAPSASSSARTLGVEDDFLSVEQRSAGPNEGASTSSPSAASSVMPEALEDGFVIVPQASSLPQVVAQVKDEDATMAQHLFKLIDPYLRHEMRTIVEGLLTKGMETAGYHLDNQLRMSAINASRVAGAGLTYGVGGVLSTISSFVPVIGPVLGTTGAGMTSTFGTVAGGYAGGLVGDALAVSTVSNVAKRMDTVTRFISNQLLEYTPEEHALYGLNDKATVTERALFEEDYALHDRLKNTYAHSGVEVVRLLVTGNMTTLLARASASVQDTALAPFNALCALFGRNQGVSVEEAVDQSGLEAYRNTEEHARRLRRESAFRTLAVAQHTKLPEGATLLENLKKHPSYAFRMGTHPKGAPSQGDTSQAAKAFAQDLEMISWDIAGEFSSPRNYLKNCDHTLNMLLALSPAEQDLLIDMKGISLGGEAFDEMRAQLSETSSLEEATAVVKGAIAKEAAKRNAAYAKENANDLAILRAHSISENLTDADLVELHKRLAQHEEESKHLLASQNTLVPGDTLRVVANYYNDIVGVQKGHILGQFYKDEMRRTGQAHALVSEVRETIKSQEIDPTQANALRAIHATGASFQAPIMDLVRPVRDIDAPYARVMSDTFNLQRTAFLKDLAREVIEKADAPIQPQSSSWLSFKAKSASTSVTPEILEPNAKALEVALETDALEVYDPTWRGHFSFKEVLNSQESFKGHNLFALNAQDLDFLSTALVDQKATQLSDQDRAFYEAHRHEVFAHLSQGTSSVRDLLWFNLDRVIDEMRAQNAALLERLFAL
ncbi:MAG: hypothetical protein C0514_06485 [Candidatus Puniceispirillum sp.]|nr:hypothetical protein [Candidatus Puniceispirillum sp.]